MTLTHNYTSRKFLLTVAFTVFGIVAAFAGKLTGEYVALATLVIGAYSAGNVAAKRAPHGQED